MSVFIVVSFVAVLAAAQTNTAEISGVVRDAQGSVLPGATVIGQHIESGIRTERVTDGSGRYVLPSLRIGLIRSRLNIPGSSDSCATASSFAWDKW
jgi:Carboxypeptidase regulatory-like domain